ncbi:hypothetical protein ANN_01818 [Periplaneta americana]|uniref:Uncharacterized protein n=1 Tax=Periplaneta americana TaxID=6978 RepID=A0ABQ8TY00_PERAM|nr:hypothetical protein ANN_01818 [Periplaneta americana]
MSPGSSTESYPEFSHIGLRENPGKNLNQVTCPDRESNPGQLVSRPDALTVTPQVGNVRDCGLANAVQQRVIDSSLSRIHSSYVAETEINDLRSEMRNNVKVKETIKVAVSSSSSSRRALDLQLIRNGAVFRELGGDDVTMTRQNTGIANIDLSKILLRTCGNEMETLVQRSARVRLVVNKTSYNKETVASWSKESCLGLALRNASWFESSWEKKFSHEISTSVWDRCPLSIVMHLGSYDRTVWSRWDLLEGKISYSPIRKDNVLHKHRQVYNHRDIITITGIFLQGRKIYSNCNGKKTCEITGGWINFENETQDRQEWRNAICEREGKDSGFSYDLLDGTRTTFRGMVLRDQPDGYCRRNGRTYYEHVASNGIFFRALVKSCKLTHAYSFQENVSNQTLTSISQHGTVIIKYNN